jgi:transposase
MNQTELFIGVDGVDVSKNYLDVAFGHLEDAPVERFQNATEPVAQLVARLQQLQPTLIVLESTGGYERLLMEACHKAQLPVAQVAGARLCQGGGAAGQDRPAGRAAVGALWGAHAPGGG